MNLSLILLNSLYYKLHNIILKHSSSYIDSPKWLEKKRTAVNPKNNDDRCFQYDITVALNYQNIRNNPERLTKIKPFIDKYNWKEISFPIESNK